MKILGYLLVLALFGGNNKYNNFSIEVQKVRQLVKDIFKHDETTNEPHFTEDDLRRGNLINKGTVAKYYSKAIRDYIIYHNVSSEEEGFIMTFNNFKPSSSVHAANKTAENKENTPTVIFVPKEGVNVNDVSNKDLRSAISEYIDTIQEKINSHEIGVAPAKSDLLELDVENNHLTVTPTRQNDAEVPKELSKSRVYNPNKLNEDDTKISNGLRVEKNDKKSKDTNKTNLPYNNVYKVPREKLLNVSLDKNGTSKNKEIKKSDLNKFLYERKIRIHPEVAEIPDKKVLKVIEDKFTDKMNTTQQNIGIPDLLNKQDSLVYNVKQKRKENLSKTNENIVNHSFNALEKKQKIHKIPQAIEKSHIDLKSLDINNMHNGSIPIKTINDNENKPENDTILEAKSGNGLESHSKGEQHQTKYPTIGESELAVPKGFHVNDFENKTTTVDKQQIVLEDVSSIKSNDSDLLKSYKKVSESTAHKLTKLDKPEEHREREFQVNELIKNDRSEQDGIDNKINSKLETNNENLGDDGKPFKHNENIAERPSFDTDKGEIPKSGNKRKCESENKQIVRNVTNPMNSKDLKDLVKPIETETVDSQEPYKATSKWNNGKNLNGEENNNSEEDTEREPYLEALNLDEIERAQEQGFAIELPNNYETVSSSSSEEDDWDENDDYNEY